MNESSELFVVFVFVFVCVCVRARACTEIYSDSTSILFKKFPYK
jgi:hypothetical protein